MRYCKYRLELVEESVNTYDADVAQSRLTKPAAVADFARWALHLHLQTEEVVYMVALNTKGAVIGVFEVGRGSLNMSILHPREVFKRALLVNAASIIMLHNHPSGDPTPSREDQCITKRLCDGGVLLSIKVLDHVIVGEGHHSMKESGILGEGYFK